MTVALFIIPKTNGQFAGPAILELNTQRVQRWGAGVKEFLPKLWYIPGEEHTLVDTFSHLLRLEDELDQQAIELDATCSIL